MSLTYTWIASDYGRVLYLKLSVAVCVSYGSYSLWILEFCAYKIQYFLPLEQPENLPTVYFEMDGWVKFLFGRI